MNLLLAITLVQMPWTANLPSRGLALDILRPSFRAGVTSATGVGLQESA